MYRLEIIKNYLVITNTTSNATIDFPRSRVRYIHYTDTFIFKYIDGHADDKSFLFDDLLDPQGAPWVNIDALLTFLQQNTG